MVGVAGRSKGCKTCRERRIAVRETARDIVVVACKANTVRHQCSLERPSCYQCVKSNRVCLGYQKELVFISTSGPDVGRKASRITTHQGSLLREVEADRQVQIISGQPDVQARTQVLNESRKLQEAAYRHQLLGTFISRYGTATDSRILGQRSWLGLIPTLPKLDSALESSTYAFCTARLGREWSNPSLVQESMKLYVRGLQQVQIALWDPRLQYEDETLAACMLLCMYEVYECTTGSRTGYQSHHKGCAKLVQLRGPYAHIRGLGHSIFAGFRFMAALEALEAKQTFLCSQDWLEIPFSVSSKTPLDLLLDLLLEAPELQVRADKLSGLQSPQVVLETALVLCQDCWNLDARLEQFFQNLLGYFDGPLYWLISQGDSMTLVGNGTCRTDFPHLAYHFPDIRIAQIMLLYWSALAMLRSGIAHLNQLTSSIAPPINADCQLPGGTEDFESVARLPTIHDLDYAEQARNVCRSIGYCMQEDMITLGLAVVTAPLKIVIDVFESWEGYESEINWCKKRLGVVENRGIRVAKYL